MKMLGQTKKYTNMLLVTSFTSVHVVKQYRYSRNFHCKKFSVVVEEYEIRHTKYFQHK